MLRTYTLPKSRAAAQHLAELHLRRAGPRSRLRVFSRLVEAVIGVGYAVLALSMDGESGQPAEPDKNEATQYAAEVEQSRSARWPAVLATLLGAVLVVGTFLVMVVL